MENSTTNSEPIYAATQPASQAASQFIQLLIADDQELYRFELRKLLQAAPDIEIVGEAETGLQAVEMAHSLKPDVVLMDIHMPLLDGIEATRQIVAGQSKISVIILTAYCAPGTVLEALNAGAIAHLGKQVDSDTLIRAIRAAGLGQALIDSQVTYLLLGEFKRLSHLKQP